MLEPQREHDYEDQRRPERRGHGKEQDLEPVRHARLTLRVPSAVAQWALSVPGWGRLRSSFGELYGRRFTQEVRDAEGVEGDRVRFHEDGGLRGSLREVR